MYREIFGQRMKEARETKGMTQIEVEVETGIKRTSLSRYESNKREPDIETIGKLAELYEVSIDWIFGLGKKKAS